MCCDDVRSPGHGTTTQTDVTCVVEDVYLDDVPGPGGPLGHDGDGYVPEDDDDDHNVRSVEDMMKGNCYENDDTMGLGLVEDDYRDEQRRVVERINKQIIQGTVKNYCIDKSSLGGAEPKENGGGSKRDGEDRSMVEPRLKEAFVSNRYGVKIKGFKKKAMAKKKTKLGAKSKSGKKPVLREPDSDQLGIRSFFLSGARPESIGSPMGLGSTLQ